MHKTSLSEVPTATFNGALSMMEHLQRCSVVANITNLAHCLTTHWHQQYQDVRLINHARNPPHLLFIPQCEYWAMNCSSTNSSGGISPVQTAAPTLWCIHTVAAIDARQVSTVYMCCKQNQVAQHTSRSVTDLISPVLNWCPTMMQIMAGMRCQCTSKQSCANF